MNIWIQIGFVAISAAVPLLIAWAVSYLRRLRPERELTLRLRSQVSLPGLDLESEVGPLEMAWAGEKIDNLVISRWRLSNSGPKSIRSADFDGDMKVEFPEHNFLSVSVSSGDPHQLEARAREAISKEIEGFAVKPLLWNTKESIDLTIVTQEAIRNVNQLEIDARIESGKVKLVDDTGSDRAQTETQMRNMALAMAFAAIVAAVMGLILSLVT